ncbi:hypothetical protein GOODEAATRI_024594, partial [Goodea atripinnis]
IAMGITLVVFSTQILQVASVSDRNQSAGDDELADTQQDGLSIISEADLECESERVNGSPLKLPLSQQPDAGDCKDNCHTARSTLLSVISGVGELNIEDNPQKAAESASSPTPADTPYPDCPYLLLDVRDRDQYDCCHIISGLKVIAQKFPSGMTTGCIPASCLSSPNSLKGRKCSVAQQPAQAAEKRCRFTSDELEKIQEQMEEMIIPSYSDTAAGPQPAVVRVLPQLGETAPEFRAADPGNNPQPHLLKQQAYFHQKASLEFVFMLLAAVRKLFQEVDNGSKCCCVFTTIGHCIILSTV